MDFERFQTYLTFSQKETPSIMPMILRSTTGNCYNGIGQKQILAVEILFLTAAFFSFFPDRFLYILYNAFRFCL